MARRLPGHRETTAGVRLKAPPCAEVSTTEEPGAGKLHAGDCAEVPGSWYFYRGGGKISSMLTLPLCEETL